MLPIILAIKDENDRLLVERIYETYEKHMFMIALGILHNQQDAEDAVNNTVIKIIDYLEKFVDISCEETKRLIVIYTRSVAIDMYRSKQKKANVFTIADDELEREFKSDEPEPDDVILSMRYLLSLKNRHGKRTTPKNCP